MTQIMNQGLQVIRSLGEDYARARHYLAQRTTFYIKSISISDIGSYMTWGTVRDENHSSDTCLKTTGCTRLLGRLSPFTSSILRYR